MGLAIKIPFNMEKALAGEWFNFSFGCLSSIKWILYEATATVDCIKCIYLYIFDN